MKRRLLTFATVLGILSASLIPATAATAAPLSDAFCTWSGVEAEEANCSPILYTTWQPTAIDSAPVVFAQMSADGINPNSELTTPASITDATGRSSGGVYAAEPSNVAALPLSLSTGVQFFNGSTYELVDLYATVVGPDTWNDFGTTKAPLLNGEMTDASSFPNPYTQVGGTLNQVIEEGTTFAVTTTETTTQADFPSYSVSIPFASPTYTVSTNGTLNAIGYSAVLTAQLRDRITGEIVTASQSQAYYVASTWSADLQALAPALDDCTITGTQICGAVGAASFTVFGWYADAQPTDGGEVGPTIGVTPAANTCLISGAAYEPATQSITGQVSFLAAAPYDYLADSTTTGAADGETYVVTDASAAAAITNQYVTSNVLTSVSTDTTTTILGTPLERSFTVSGTSVDMSSAPVAFSVPSTQTSGEVPLTFALQGVNGGEEVSCAVALPAPPVTTPQTSTPPVIQTGDVVANPIGWFAALIAAALAVGGVIYFRAARAMRNA